MKLEDFKYVEYNGGINLTGFNGDLKDQIEELVIPNEWNVVAITKLSCYYDDPFAGYTKLKKVVLPTTLKQLNDAFCYCENLTDVIFPDNLEVLGNWNFRNCNSLEKITLPTSLKRIGFGNFEDSPVFLSEYDDEGDGCVYLGNNLLTCLINDDDPFEIKEGTVLIADCAFSNKRFSEIIFPSTLKYIGSQAFYCCNNIKKPIELPDSIEWIGEKAFFTENGDIVESIFVTDGRFDENGKLILNKELGYISKDNLNKAVEKLEGYALQMFYEESSSYDNSDDDRVEDSSSSYSSYCYRDIDPLKNSKALLRINNEIVGVVFRVKSYYSNEEPSLYSYLFDGSYSSGMTLGYSASHSSNFITVKRIKLVKKGENDVPTSNKVANFTPSQTSTSI